MKEMMNDDFADVTLVSEDKKHFRAHRNILSASSPVFKDKLQKDTQKKICLEGINFSESESIMNFIYLGEATLYEEGFKKFIAVARSLQIKQFCNAETLKNDDDESSPCDPLALANNSREQTIKFSQLMNQVPKK